MTRLSEALERAGVLPAEDTGAAGGEKVVVPEWDLSAGGGPAAETPLARAGSGPSAVDPRVARADRRADTSAEAGVAHFSVGDLGKIVVGEAEPAFVEQFRHLAAALHRAQGAGRIRVVMIASGAAAEGKTLTAANVALTLGDSYGRQVLLIDADLRRPSLHTLFGVSNEAGLADALERAETARQFVRPVSPHLTVLTSGPLRRDPMQLLVSDRMRQLLADAAEQFDWVIIDTPPVVALPDARLLAAMVDAIIVVVGANSTPYTVANRAIETLGREKVLGVVLNRVRQRELREEYGYGSYQGYGQNARAGKRRRWLTLSSRRAS